MKYTLIFVGIVLVHLSKAALPTGCDVDGVDCPANSACAADNDCACDDGFKLNGAGDGCVAKALPTGCDANGVDCPANSACAADNDCACDDGFKLNDAGNGCVAKEKVSEVDCTKSQADQCKHTPNAKCNNDASAAKCKCSDGYAEDKTDGSTCVKILGGDCSSAVTCTDTGNAACTGGKCTCKEDYGENNDICVQTVEGTTCKDGGNECDSIKNSHCGNLKCKCDAGYVMNVDVCTADSAAPMVQFGWMTILLSVLTIVLPLF